MKKVLIMPVLSAVLLTAACGEGRIPTEVDTRAEVRFFNATAGMTGSGGFTTSGQFATGSALAFGNRRRPAHRSMQVRHRLGSAANTGGTGLSGSALATLDNQSVTASGNFTLASTGSATSPQLFLFDNRFPGSLGTTQAAVRFVNLAPGDGTPSTNFFVTKGALGDPFVHSNIALGEPTTFNTLASGSHQYTILRGHHTVISGSEATLNLQAGTVNTIAIVPNTSGGFELINIPRC